MLVTIGVAALGALLGATACWVLAAAGRRRDGAAREATARDAAEARAELAAARAEVTRLAAAVQAAQDGEARAARVREELVATVSHELRTPLNVVLGWARLLRQGKLDAAGAARAAETIERSATAQAQIVDDLLDGARIARGELRLDVRPVDLVPVVEAALDAVRPAAVARTIQLAAVLMPRAGTVSGDPGRLQQVVWNLLSNGVKFTPPGGRVEVRLEPDGDGVAIRVRDTGAGLAPDLAPLLFERFRQADSSSTRAHGGLGMGLALVRHIVEAHGGTVAAESPGPGKGSTFTVRLPCAGARRRGAAEGARGAAGERPASAASPAGGPGAGGLDA